MFPKARKPFVESHTRFFEYTELAFDIRHGPQVEYNTRIAQQSAVSP